MVGGCFQQFRSKLSCLIPTILQQFKDSSKHIRTISCWCISNILSSIMQDSGCKIESCPLAHYSILLLIDRLEDSSISVINAAYSSIVILIEKSKEIMIKYLIDLLRKISRKLIQPNPCSKSLLYDLIKRILITFNDCYHIYSHAFEEIKKALNADWRFMITSIHYVLSSEYKILNQENEKESFSQCSMFLDFYICLADSKISFIEENCVRIAADTLDELRILRGNRIKSIEEFNPQKLLMCSKLLFLFTIIIQYPQLESIIQSAELLEDLLYLGCHKTFSHSCISVISRLVDLDHFEVKQKIEAVITFLDMQLNISQYINNTLPQEETAYSNAILSCGNAAWTLSSISIKHGRNWSHTHTNSVINKIQSIFSSHLDDKFMLQNVSILLGRLALTRFMKVSEILPVVLSKCLIGLRSISNCRAKQEAFTGILNAIIFNPANSVPNLVLLLDAIKSYSDAPPTLQQLFHELLNAYRRNLREKWDLYIKVVPLELKNALKERLLI